MCIDDIQGFRLEQDTARFWAKVDKRGPADCWLSQRYWTSQGQSVFKVAGRYYRTTRIAYLIALGPIPSGLCVCHACDEPRCLNPSHLFLDTIDGNNKDKARKGRGRKKKTDKSPFVLPKYKAAPCLTIEQRFEKRRTCQRADDCWMWDTCGKDGYGYISWRDSDGKHKMTAHRFAYKLAYGDIPDGLVVAHECDIRYAPGDITYRRCCNPAHLSVKSNRDNIIDSHAKGRGVRGSRSAPALYPERYPRGDSHPNAKMSSESVLLLREKRRAGMSYPALAKLFGVSIATAQHIATGKTWRHLL